MQFLIDEKREHCFDILNLLTQTYFKLKVLEMKCRMADHTCH